MTQVRSIEAMAMTFRLAVEGDRTDASTLDVVAEHIASDLLWVDEVFSTYREDSWVSRLSRSEATIAEAPPAVAEVLDMCEHFHEETGGAFNARSPDGGIDPTGLVKTWAMERSRWRLGLLGAAGVLWGCAGDVTVDGVGPVDGGWRIGIADPRSPAGEAAPIVSTAFLEGRSKAVATSGDAQRPGHIWDPRTRASAQHFAQVSVRGTDLIECDAWATAIMAGGKRTLRLAIDRGFEVLALRVIDGRVHSQATPGWDRSQK